jgi:hypothetical protein
MNSGTKMGDGNAQHNTDHDKPQQQETTAEIGFLEQVGQIHR